MTQPASSDRIRSFYDRHAREVQERTGLNIRHRAIMRKLIRAGLGRAGRVLEVGCGIGTLTELIARRSSKGRVVGLDISNEAVRIARDRLRRFKHVDLRVGELSDIEGTALFDFIVLPDVLEHIPQESHEQLFAELSTRLSPLGRVCINIPDPYTLEWMRENTPEKLQIIDQSLMVADIVAGCTTAGLTLDRFERYSLWHLEPDYNWIEFTLPQARASLTMKPYPRRILEQLFPRLL